MSSDRKIYKALVVLNLGRTSRQLRMAALELPPEAAPLLFAAADLVGKAADIATPDAIEALSQQLRLPAIHQEETIHAPQHH